jgi:RNA polymerase sigma factor (sigma-70 family)
MLVEDLDDSEYQQSGFIPPASSNDDPEQVLERRDRVLQILHALSRVPERDRMVFELFAIEGFSKQEVANIVDIPIEEVEGIAERVRTEVLQKLRANRKSRNRASGIPKAS